MGRVLFRGALSTVDRSVREHQLLVPGEGVVVAVSGGADSVFLLSSLVALAGPLALRLHVAHIDHGWRGAAGAADALWVADLAGRLGLPYHGASVDAPQYARDHGLSPEDAARRLRYAFLGQVCQDVGVAVVATGHTEDDQLETIILALLRGAGPTALGGMGWSAPLPTPEPVGRRVIRPLLALTRGALRQALRASGQSWREDATNLDLRLPRSRVRLEVLPLLESVAPGARRALLRSASLTRQAGTYVGEVARGAAASLFQRHGTAQRARRAAFLALEPPLRGEALRWAVAELRSVQVAAQVQVATQVAEVRAPEWAHVLGALEMIGRGRGGAVAWLAPGVQLRLERGWIVVEPQATKVEPQGIMGREKDMAASERPPQDSASPVPASPVPGSPVLAAGSRAGFHADIEEILITEHDLNRRVSELAAEVQGLYVGQDLVLIGVLKGAIMFMTDLARQLPLPLEMDFMAVSSYGNATQSSGVVRITKDLDGSIEGRNVLLVEDVVDSGLTLRYLLENLRSRNPASLRVCALLNKRVPRKADVTVDHVGFVIPNRFVVGYGLDFAENYRNLPYIGVLKTDVYATS